MVRDTAIARGCNAAFQMCVFAPAHYWQMRNIPFLGQARISCAPCSAGTIGANIQSSQTGGAQPVASLLCSPHSDVSWCHVRDVSLTLSVQVTLALLLIRALTPLCCSVFKPELTT